MKATLISTLVHPSDQGIRIISSVLKREGVDVQIIFMASEEQKYKQKEIEQLLEYCRGSDLIGINAFAYTSRKAIQIIKFLEGNLNVPIVWGGIHATICPEECIKHCNIVCVGEGEKTVVELSKAIDNKKPITKIKNLWIKESGKIIKNDLNFLVDELDEIPFPDYELKTHFILDKSKIRPFLPSDLSNKILFLTGRGCPYGCEYCSNNKLNKIYEGKRTKIVRWHSIDYAIEEILFLKKKFPVEFKYADIRDDTFTWRPLDQIKLFCKRYKKEVGLPIRLLVDPKSVNKEKMDLLVDAGCIEVSMGIEADERVNKEIYHRNVSDEQVLKSTKLLNSYNDKVAVTYDVLGCNPYAEKEDILNLINLLRKIPKSYYLNICNLVLLPGTGLYYRALDDGIIKNKKDTAIDLHYAARAQHILLRKKNVYLNLVLNLMRGLAIGNKHGSLSNNLLSLLAKKKRVDWHTKNPFISLTFTKLLWGWDYAKYHFLIPLYVYSPKSIKRMYIKLRYPEDIHYKNLETVGA